MIGALLGDYVGYLYDKHFSGELERFLSGEKVELPPMGLSSCVRMNAAVTQVLQDLEGSSWKADEVIQGLQRKLMEWAVNYPNSWPENDVRYPRLTAEPLIFPAMRVSSVGWICQDLEEARKVAALTAKAYQKDREAILAAEMVAAAIFILKDEEFDLAYQYCMKEMAPFLAEHSNTSQEPGPLEIVKKALIACKEEKSWIDMVKRAYGEGGRTSACIAGAIADAQAEEHLGLIGELRCQLPISILQTLDYMDGKRMVYADCSPVGEAIYGHLLPESGLSALYGAAQLEEIIVKLLASTTILLPIHPRDKKLEKMVLAQRKNGDLFVVSDAFFEDHRMNLELMFSTVQGVRSVLTTLLFSEKAFSLPKETAVYQTPLIGFLKAMKNDEAIQGMRLETDFGSFVLKRQDWDRCLTYGKWIFQYQKDTLR